RRLRRRFPINYHSPPAPSENLCRTHDKSEKPKRNQTGFISREIEGMKQKETGGCAAGFPSSSIRAPRPAKNLCRTQDKSKNPKRNQTVFISREIEGMKQKETEAHTFPRKHKTAQRAFCPLRSFSFR
ncbi:MAG: hypothetical protein J6Z45_02955, partial [Oscillospiraceae bacterium]|nr:hypothetical protein [Oscillospiraceae bacterium]